MEKVFPEPILGLPEADFPLDGARAYLSQGDDHQIVFMKFSKEVDLPEHAHESQWGVILEGKVELQVEGIRKTYSKGDRYFIAKGARHSGHIYPGAVVFEFFNQRDRYKAKMGAEKTELKSRREKES